MPTRAPRNRDDVVYARCFADKAEGHYLWKTKTLEELRPGTCGYFDDYGDWEEIADLTRPEQETPPGDGKLGPRYKFIPGISTQIGKGQTRWNGRISTGMHRVQATLSAGGGQTGLASGEITVAYASATGEGAILLTDGDVTFTQARPETKLCEWMVANGKATIKEHPRAKHNGLWIVTKTYSVPQARTALVKDRRAQIALSIKAEADRFGSLEGGAGWWRASASGAWNELKDPKGAGVVVAFDGIFWEDHWYQRTIRPVTEHLPSFLGGPQTLKLEPITFDAEDIDAECSTLEFVPEVRGRLETLN